MRCCVPALYGLLACGITLGGAAAEPSCRDAVDQLAEELGFETALPSPASQAPSMTDKLKGSGGVLQPPDVGAPVAVIPPETAGRMPTAPAIPPQTAEGEPAPRLGTARQAQLESLLMAARAAADRGNSAECRARLAEAEQLAAAGE